VEIRKPEARPLGGADSTPSRGFHRAPLSWRGGEHHVPPSCRAVGYRRGQQDPTTKATANPGVQLRVLRLAEISVAPRPASSAHLAVRRRPAGGESTPLAGRLSTGHQDDGVLGAHREAAPEAEVGTARHRREPIRGRGKRGSAAAEHRDGNQAGGDDQGVRPANRSPRWTKTTRARDRPGTRNRRQQTKVRISECSSPLKKTLRPAPGDVDVEGDSRTTR